jgi:mono/diheme cytochrome c family protein
LGPSLRDERKRKTYAQTIEWIEDPVSPMPKLYPSPLSDKDVADVAAYVQTL